LEKGGYRLKSPELIGTNRELLSILLSHIVDFMPFFSEAQLISLKSNLDHEFHHRSLEVTKTASPGAIREAMKSDPDLREVLGKPLEGSMIECSTGDLIEALDTHYETMSKKPLGVVMCGCGERPQEERDKPFYTILVRCSFLRCPDCSLLLYEKEA
jgi:hypothetical protein